MIGIRINAPLTVGFAHRNIHSENSQLPDLLSLSHETIFKRQLTH